MSERLLTLLRCPRCGAAPDPTKSDCPSCGRLLRSISGGFDLLTDNETLAADLFAERYRSLRRQEGWIQTERQEDPSAGPPQLWQQRVKSVSRAAALLARLAGTETGRPIVVDIGAGSGWADGLLQDFDVIAIDLIEPLARRALSVRGDMSRLPLNTQSVDAALFAASLHYAPVSEAIPEASRVLRCGGLLIAVDSPIYPDTRSASKAKARSVAYYTRTGFPQLGDRYLPIEALELRRVMEGSGFRILRFEVGSLREVLWRRLTNQAPASLIMAEKTC